MNKKRNFITAAVVLFLCFAFFGCENDTGNENDTDSENDFGDRSTEYTAIYSDNEIDLSKLLGWAWGIDGSEKTGLDYVDYDFKWIFQTDGTITCIHCCGAVFHNQYSYLFNGNVFFAYGSEMDSDQIYVTTFTMADDGLSFTLNTGNTKWRSFTRADNIDEYRGNADWAFKTEGSNLELTNKLLGTWQDDGGTEYVFGSDASLKIDTDLYGYLVRGTELLTLGPLVDGTIAVLQKYKYQKTGKNLYLQYVANGKTELITLSSAE